MDIVCRLIDAPSVDSPCLTGAFADTPCLAGAFAGFIAPVRHLVWTRRVSQEHLRTRRASQEHLQRLIGNLERAAEDLHLTKKASRRAAFL
ncbi:hypothetical protein C4D60_Mb05t13320 [Musa balbisiana]|uniref:Uncharacterized protein n=1 Tax=Musa balbisiana TaxID=52838 RepID=A0A4S8JVV2_MUSBA|nr:hypothetical protein C4D60_Mb05t13320 [Musa balbisiana]